MTPKINIYIPKWKNSMYVINPRKFEELIANNKKKSESILPELIKRLIISGCNQISSIRIPDKDDIWAPGYDGVIEVGSQTEYVNSGKSVWEFGTTGNGLNKINSDYQKRTDSPLGIKTDEATFYLVTPYIWAHRVSITEWEAEKNSQKKWRQVRVYDASILVDWINSEPSVLAWFIEQYSLYNISFSTVSGAWNSFSNKTNPKMTSNFFIAQCQMQVAQFLECCKNNTVIRVRAETTLEAQGFVLSSLLQDKDFAENCIVINDKVTYHKISELVKNKLLFLNFRYEDDIHLDDNSIILCFGKCDTSIRPDVQLPVKTKSQIESNLIEMGLSVSEANEAYFFSHGNIFALIRQLPGQINMPKPGWTNSTDLEYLFPLLFLRSFSYDHDRVIVESLSDASYEEIEKKYNEFLRMEDSPIKKTGNYYVINNYEEVWEVLNPSIESKSFNLLVSTVFDLLDSVRSNESWKGYSKDSSYFHNLFSNMLQSLSFFSYTDPSNRKIPDIVSRILEFLPYSNTFFVLGPNLIYLAEASPETVMNYIANDLKNKEGFISQIFNSDGNSYKCSYFLSALEELSKYQESAIDSCRTLFALSIIKKEYAPHNSPRDSLLTILCLWDNYSILDLSQKVLLVKKFIHESEHDGIILALELISKNTNIHGIRYRSIYGKKISEKEFGEALRNAIDDLSEIVFDKTSKMHCAEIVKKIINQYYYFSPILFARFVNDFSSEIYEPKELILLNYEVRMEVCNLVRDFPERKDSFYKTLSVLINKTSPKDPVDCISWMFRDQFFIPFDELTDIEYRLDEMETIFTQRQKELKTLFSTNGIDAIQRLYSNLEDIYYWGDLLGKTFSSDIVISLCQNLLFQKKIEIFCGAYDTLPQKAAYEFFVLLDSKDKMEILPHMRRSNIDNWLSGEEEIKAYWQNKDSNPINEKEYRTRLEVCPQGLLRYCYEIVNANSSNCITITFEILNAICRDHNISEFNRRLDNYLLQEIVEQIDSRYYSDEWGLLCLQLFNLDLLKRLTEGIKKLFFYSPNFFRNSKMIEKSKTYPFRSQYRLPACAYDNYKNFKYFFEHLIQNKENYLIGNVLGKEIISSNNQMPHLFILQTLEEINNYEVDHAISLAIIITQGCRTISDGENLRQQAEEYEKKAKECEIDYPHMARIFREIKNSLLSDANQDQIRAELFL